MNDNSIQKMVLLPFLALINAGVVDNSVAVSILNMYPNLDITWDEHNRNNDDRKQFYTHMTFNKEFIQIDMYLDCPYCMDSGYVSKVIFSRKDLNSMVCCYDGWDTVIVIKYNNYKCEIQIPLASIKSVDEGSLE